MRDIKITGETRLADLLAVYPQLKARLPEINERFSMLNTPIGAVMAKKATIADMSKRSGTEQNLLIKKIAALIEQTV